MEDRIGMVGVVLDGRYRIEEAVAEGGFGFVFRAEHLLWKRKVAVKVFKVYGGDERRAELREAFIREGAILNELSRKTNSIVQSYDVGTWRRPDGRELLYTVLEWLEGRSLADLWKAESKAPWPLPRILATLGPAAEALAVAHENGIAHRDVKPNNIFIVEEQGHSSVKLLDFGAAKVAAEHVRGFDSTGSMPAVFTASYAAPEQLARQFLPPGESVRPTGPWTDVYALAVVIVELMLGRHPTTAGEVVVRPTPRALGIEVSNALEAVFTKALESSPESRYREARAFWNDLAKAAKGGWFRSLFPGRGK